MDMHKTFWSRVMGVVLACGAMGVAGLVGGCDPTSQADAAPTSAPSAETRPPGHAAGTTVPGLPAPEKGSATLDGLFLVVRFSGMSISNFYYFFTPAGYVTTSMPKGGLEQFDFAAAVKDHPDSTGTYVIDGDTIKITTANGKNQTVGYAINKEHGYVELDGLYAHKAEPFPPGTMFDGTYTFTGASGGGGVFVATAQTYTFHPDGTYDWTGAGSASLDTSNTTAAASSESSTRGTYTVNGNTLELTSPDGTVQRRTIFPYENYDGQIELNIDGGMYAPE